MRLQAWAVLAVAFLTGCRDAASAPDYREREPHPDSASVQLTYSLRDDRLPAWNGDSLYYSTFGQASLSKAHEWIAAIHRLGPITRVLLPDQQPTSALPPRLGAPAISPDGSAIALVEVTDTASLTVCALLVCNGREMPDRATIPHIARARLHVRRLSDAGVTESTLEIAFDGRERFIGQHPSGLSPVYLLRVHPFQQRYARDRDQIFRPAFSPGGDRLAFSDGLQIYIWTIGGSIEVVPGTDDGVFPAWSPDGEWIAFTRLQRGVPENDMCTCFTASGKPGEFYDRVVYDGAYEPSDLVLVSPDGSTIRELGEGYGPAWTPDGGSVVVSRSDGFLWEVPLEGAARRIDATGQGREPALSADGRLLAFARLVQPGNSDIWIVPFENR